MSILTATQTVTPKPYQVRSVSDSIFAITVWTPEGLVTVNNPRTIYWTNDRYGYGMTIRANDSKNTLRCEANEYGIVTVFYRDGRIETDETHVSSLD